MGRVGLRSLQWLARPPHQVPHAVLPPAAGTLVAGFQILPLRNFPPLAEAPTFLPVSTGNPVFSFHGSPLRVPAPLPTTLSSPGARDCLSSPWQAPQSPGLGLFCSQSPGRRQGICVNLMPRSFCLWADSGSSKRASFCICSISDVLSLRIFHTKCQLW